MRCDKCGVEVVEVDNPMREEIRPRRGLEYQCDGGEGCLCGWPERHPANTEDTK